MLNEERKRIYFKREELSTMTKDSLYNVKNIISIFGNYEDVIGKDICDWSISDIKEAFISLNSTSRNTLRNYKSQLLEYTDWCIGKRLSTINQNNFYNISEDILELCVNKTLAQNQLISRDDLLEHLEKLLNWRDKFLILALYEGINMNEILDIEEKDVNGNVVRLNSGREFRMSDLLSEFARKSLDSDEYFIIRRNREEPIAYKRDEDDDHVVWITQRANSVDDDKESRQSVIFRFVKRAAVAMDMPTMTSKKFTRAGRVDYIRREASKAGMTPVEYEKKNYKEIDKIFGDMSLMIRLDYYKIIADIK